MSALWFPMYLLKVFQSVLLAELFLTEFIVKQFARQTKMHFFRLICSAHRLLCALGNDTYLLRLLSAGYANYANCLINVRRLQCVQNSAARVVLRDSPHQSTTAS